MSRRHVTDLARQGRLKAKREGKNWLIHRSLSPEEEEPEEYPKGISEEAYKKLEEQAELLKEQIKQKDKQIENLQKHLDEASHRHDTVVMQMTKLLEYHQQPFWRKLFSRKALPGNVDEKNMDMNLENNKS